MKKKFIALIEVDDTEIDAADATEVATWLAMVGAEDVTVWEADPCKTFAMLECLVERGIEHLVLPWKRVL